MLKAGPFVHEMEAETMRFVAQHASIPVPVVHDFYEKNGAGYLLMSCAEGVMLSEVRDSFTEEKRESIVSQLKGYVEQSRQSSMLH